MHRRVGGAVSEATAVADLPWNAVDAVEGDPGAAGRRGALPAKPLDAGTAAAVVDDQSGPVPHTLAEDLPIGDGGAGRVTRGAVLGAVHEETAVDARERVGGELAGGLGAFEVRAMLGGHAALEPAGVEGEDVDPHRAVHAGQRGRPVPAGEPGGGGEAGVPDAAQQGFRLGLVRRCADADAVAEFAPAADRLRGEHMLDPRIEPGGRQPVGGGPGGGLRTDGGVLHAVGGRRQDELNGPGGGRRRRAELKLVVGEAAGKRL